MEKKKTKNKKKLTKRVGHIQQKVLLLLLGGLTLGLARSPKQYFRVLKSIGKEWKAIDRRSLNDAIQKLYQSKLVSSKDNRDGTLTLVLSQEGEELALTYDLDRLVIKEPTVWDKKWRVVMFDVPENLKKVRDMLRMHFKDMGFYEFQKSVFVHPYPCREEIELIIEHYNARHFIRFIIATDIDNAIELKRHFRL